MADDDASHLPRSPTRPRRYLRAVGCAALIALASTLPARGSTSERHASVRPALTATVEGWHNAHGGLETSSRWNSLVDLRTEIDAAVLRLPTTGFFVVHVRWVEAQDNDSPMAAVTGAFVPVSNLMANSHVRVFNLHFRQNVSDAWAWKIGQLAADDDFIGSEYGAVFINSGFGAMPSQVATPLSAHSGGAAAFPIFPVAGPGLWFEHKVVGGLTWQNGLYYGGPGADRRGNRGFSYAGWSGAGASVFSELSWASNFRGHPAHSRLGTVLHSGRFDDFAAERATPGARPRRGLYSLYAVQDFAVLADSAGKTKLGAFVRAGVSPAAGRSVITAYTDGGLAWFGPVPGRAEDVAGVGLSRSHFGQDYRAINDLAPSETTLEFTYRAPLTSHLVLQADAQMLFDLARNLRSEQRETGTVFGLRASLSF